MAKKWGMALSGMGEKYAAEQRRLDRKKNNRGKNMKIHIRKDEEEIEAEEILERTVERWGNSQAYIMIPKKFAGYNVLVVLKGMAPKWLPAGYTKSQKKTEY